MAKILVTGVAGFIGMHVALRWISNGEECIGIDNLNDYYDIQLKYDRLKQLNTSSHSEHFTFIQCDITDKEALRKLFEKYHFSTVIHLAAQAGIRYSFTHPETYVQVNIVGFFNVLQVCREFGTCHLLYASSSSVYGHSDAEIYREDDRCETPMNMYAASKKSNELMAHSYASLYGMQVSGLRFFTIYGPWGRPDMAPMIFADAITQGKEIPLFNGGEMFRDFTFIDDIVDAVMAIAQTPPKQNYSIYNIGHSEPIKMSEFVQLMQKAFCKKTRILSKPMQKGEVLRTFAEVQRLRIDYGFAPKISITQGLKQFVSWYRDYYGVN